MSTTREQTTQTEKTDSPITNTTISNSFLEHTAISTSLSAAKSSEKEPAFPSGLIQVSEEAGTPAVQTFYAVNSDNLARRETQTPVTLQSEDKPLSLPGESNAEDSGAAHNVATKTVRFSDDLFSQAREIDSSPVYEMNTLDTSENIASFQVLTDSVDTTIKISEPTLGKYCQNRVMPLQSTLKSFQTPHRTALISQPNTFGSKPMPANCTFTPLRPYLRRLSGHVAKLCSPNLKSLVP